MAQTKATQAQASFDDILGEVPTKSSGLPCGVAEVRDKLSEANRERLDYWLFEDGRTQSNPKIIAAINALGFYVSESSVAKHRRRGCRCFIGKTAVMGETK